MFIGASSHIRSVSEIFDRRTGGELELLVIDFSLKRMSSVAFNFPSKTRIRRAAETPGNTSMSGLT